MKDRGTNTPLVAANRPKVLFLHQGGELYGSDIIFYQVVQAVSSLADPVIVLSEPGPLVEKLRQLTKNISIFELGVLRRQHFSPRGVFRCAVNILIAVFKIIRLARQGKVKLIYSNTIGVLPGAVAAKLLGVPHIWHIHEIIEKPKPLWRVLSAVVGLCSAAVVAVSRATANHLIKGCSWNANKTTVVYNGISTEPFENADGKPIRQEFGVSDETYLVCMVGRISSWKGQDCLIEAARYIKTNFSDFKILIVGDVFRGNEWILSDLREKVRAFGLEDTVIFTGYRTDVPSIIKAADIVAVPSVAPDPLPTVALEAMACSKPVVSSAVGGLPEIVEDGVTGFVVPPNDPETLADKMMLLGKSHELRTAMGRKGRDRFDKMFSLERFAAEIQGVILDAVETEKPAVSRQKSRGDLEK